MENIYEAPKAALVEPPTSEFGPPFFVTSIRKLCLLFLLTWGLYAFYWSFKQWFTQRRSAGEKVTPLWRSILYVFYTHSLFRLINQRLALQERPYWRAGWAPHCYVGITVVVVLLNLVIGNNESAAALAAPVVFVLLTVKAWALASMQRQANLASGDPQGASNAGLSSWNWLFVVVGGVFSAVSILGFFAVALGYV